MQLLEELGALERQAPATAATAHRGSAAGWPALPIDPRLGRMVLEAERHGCLREVS